MVPVLSRKGDAMSVSQRERRRLRRCGSPVSRPLSASAWTEEERRAHYAKRYTAAALADLLIDAENRIDQLEADRKDRAP